MNPKQPPVIIKFSEIHYNLHGDHNQHSNLKLQNRCIHEGTGKSIKKDARAFLHYHSRKTKEQVEATVELKSVLKVSARSERETLF